MYEFINVDDDDFLSWGAGIQELDKMDGDRRFYQTARLFNTALPRLAFRTLPQLAKGNIGWAIQSELGLYPDKKAKEYRLALDKLSPSTVEILESLEELEQFGR
jgi:hypothetical protein